MIDRIHIFTLDNATAKQGVGHSVSIGARQDSVGQVIQPKLARCAQ